ncbi:hypothetical protein [Streptomyces sp. NPDC093970]|uniref:hypothetical protein n=1 Tax=Streptomyces sp. NPDC093970 TaxID=3155076 RepID=UPI003423E59C
MSHSSSNPQEPRAVEDTAAATDIRRVPRVLVPSLVKGGASKRPGTTELTHAFISEFLLPRVELRGAKDEDTLGTS